jgi:hypothetical protein
MNFVKFFLNEAPDDKNRMLDEILNYSDYDLEKSHDIIQRIFPLIDPSEHDLKAPIIDSTEIKQIKDDEKCLKNVLRCFERMMEFYGFKYENGVLRLADDWEIKKKYWITKRNHNFKRLTRIMLCLMSFGLVKEAEYLCLYLVKIYRAHPDTIGDNTYQYWIKSVLGDKK